MSISLKDFSIVRWFENVEKHRCGYCKSENSSTSNGMWAEQLTVDDYQNLIDRGWRRSGKYCYKPRMKETCCPQYTIKCEVMKILLSKSQKKIIKRFNKYLDDEILNKKDFSMEDCVAYCNDVQEDFFKHPGLSLNVSEIKMDNEDNAITGKIEDNLGTGEPDNTVPNVSKCETSNASNNICHKLPNRKNNQGVGPDASKPPCKKAKLLRIERKKEKLDKMGLKLEDVAKKHNQSKTIEEFMEAIPKTSKIKFKTTLERMTTHSETFQDVAKLFAKYQMHVHNDPPEECDITQFTRFLVNSPLEPKDFPNKDGPGFGSFHQLYWLNEKLVAVGVIDILPKCVSSVYFFYDPDYSSLSLGTYSALREAYFTRQLQKKIPDLSYYYMGFYIHSCPKMKYKGKLVPSYLLCPETYDWVPIEKAICLLDSNKYCRLNADVNAVDANLPTAEDLMKTKIVYDRQFMSFESYKRLSRNAGIVFEQIGELIGRICLKNMVFWIE